MVSELQARGGVWLPFPASAKNPIKMLINMRKLARLVVEERADVLHVRSRAPAWVALGAARPRRAAAGDDLSWRLRRRLGAEAALQFRHGARRRRDRQLAFHRGDDRQNCIPLRAKKLRVIHRGADLRAFAPSAVDPARVTALRQAWGVAPHERIVLLAARLTGWKGQRVLIQAAAKLKLEGVRFIMAGDAQGRDSYAKELDRLIQTHQLKGIASCVGHCLDMPAAFLAASVVAVPSTEPEAFGRSAVEAQAMGTPVVVSDLGAVPETVLAPPDSAPEARTGWARCRWRRGRARGSPQRRLEPRRKRARGAGPARARACRAAFHAGADDARHARHLWVAARGLNVTCPDSSGRRRPPGEPR